MLTHRYPHDSAGQWRTAKRSSFSTVEPDIEQGIGKNTWKNNKKGNLQVRMSFYRWKLRRKESKTCAGRREKNAKKHEGWRTRGEQQEAATELGHSAWLGRAHLHIVSVSMSHFPFFFQTVIFSACVPFSIPSYFIHIESKVSSCSRLCPLIHPPISFTR